MAGCRQEQAVLAQIGETPYGYFYGDPFQENELSEAFDFLLDKGFLKKLGSSQDRTLGLELTPDGQQCVVRYGADTDEYERASRSSGVSNTYNMANVANFVAGDNHGTMNAWNQIQSSSDAATLLAAAIRLASLNGEFEGETAQRLAKECHEELIEAA